MHPHAEDREDGRARRRAALAVLACCLASLAVRLWVQRHAVAVAHGDGAYYVVLARNLCLGRGFVIDYVPDFLSGAAALPCPANTYWRPLPSLVCALGMALGGLSFAAARTAMIVLTSVAPAVVYLVGRDAFGSRRAGVLGAVLAVGCPAILTQASTPTTHGPALVVGGLALWAIGRSVAEPRWLAACGVLIGLAHLNRSDGVLLGVALVAAHLARGRAPWQLGAAALGWLVVVAPLAMVDLRATGSPLPVGLARTALATSYGDIYALPGRLSAERWLAQPAAKLVAEKRRVVRAQARWLAGGAWRGLGPPPAPESATGALARGGLALLGLAIAAGAVLALRRELLAAWVLLAALLALYGLVFTLTGRVSFRASAMALVPAMLAGAGRALELAGAGVDRLAARTRPRERARSPGRLGRLGASLRRRPGRALGAGLVAWMLAGGLEHGARTARMDALWNVELARFHHALEREVLGPHGLAETVTMTWDVHELHANTGLALVRLPVGPEADARRVARRLGVTHVLLPCGPDEGPEWTRPAALAGAASPELVADTVVRGRPVRLLRLGGPDLAGGLAATRDPARAPGGEAAER